jgi:PAS domain S-box-containing protein
VGKLVVAFRETGCASRTPLEPLLLLAELFGETFQRSVELTRERRLAMILETSGDAMMAWDAQGLVTDANAAATRLTGLSRAELLGRDIGTLLDPAALRADPAAPGRSPVRTALRRVPVAGGPEVDVVASLVVTAVEEDPQVAMHALIRDETHLAATEREAALHFGRARELEKELRALLDNAPLVIFRLDAGTGQIRYLNRHAERLLGIPTADAIGTRDFLRDVHCDPEDRSAFDAAVHNARAGKVSQSYEARLRGVSAQETAVRGTVYPLLSETGQVVAIEGILADVSAEHAARSRAVQTDRLTTLGMLIASVAHEINNPAAFILLGLKSLERLVQDREGPTESGSTEPLPALIGELRDSTNRIVSIVRDLRLFASPGVDGDVAPVSDVNEAARSAVSLARGKISEKIELVVDLSPVAPVLIHNGRLVQVLVNLLVNAIQALPKKSAHRPMIRVASRQVAGEVHIEVCDTGPGIPRENQQRIWAPFFTTKGADLGTGLGLSISREIIERAGGSISLESPTIEAADGAHGSRFVIRLPAADQTLRERALEPKSASSPAASRVTGCRAKRRVLVVDDEPALARELASQIGDGPDGHEVVAVGSGEQALAKLSGTRFDVVLCDLKMPGMSGEDLYHHVRRRDPEQASRFVFMSGIAFVPEVDRFVAAAGRRVLHKPFPAQRVLELIAEVGAGP